VLPAERIEQALATVRALEGVPDVAALARMLQGSAR
jgi:hypothetical protein